MYSFHALKSEHALMVYPYFVKAGRKKLFFLLLCSFVFVVLGSEIILTNQGKMLIGWLTVLFFGACFLVFLIQLSWGPLLLINEDGVQIRSNPFLKKITFSWPEIKTITLFDQKYKGYLSFAISPVFLQEFLQRQSFWNRKLLKKKLGPHNLTILIPQSLSPYILRSVLASIHDTYHTQIETHHIYIEIKKAKNV